MFAVLHPLAELLPLGGYLLYLPVGNTVGRGERGKGFEQLPDVIYLTHVFEGYLGDKRALEGNYLYVPVLFENTQRLADRGTAHADLIGEKGLGKRFAHLERTGVDPLV